ncbi:unnamed protein product, partial [Anisakis simplex]|uniref:Radical SAM protein n=1 Tax=Anisakis simplex TaxID=6269 RepID=A0A0M3JCE0_ANISI
VLPGGQPLLGCARPSCFGWADTVKEATDLPWFYRINNISDGFLRERDADHLRQIHRAGRDVAHISVCEPGYSSFSCDGDNQWVGGIGPAVDVPGEP